MRITISTARKGSITITGKDANGNTVVESVKTYRHNWFQRIVWRISTWLKIHRPFPTVVYIRSEGEEQHDSDD